MTIVRRKGKFCLVTRRRPRRTLGCHSTREGAQRQERAIKASQRRRKKRKGS